ncbi:MAG: EAL domain-containing protein [Clostridia bacterium]
MPDIYNILDSFPELVYITDIDTYDILYINTAGKKLFSEYNGRKCYEVLHGFTAPCDKCPVQYISGKKCHTWKYTNPHTGKTYLFRNNLIDWNGKDAHLCIAFDITEDENMRHELESHLNMENFIFQCIAEMHRNQPYDEMFNNLLDIIGKFLEADRVYIFNYNGVTISNIYEWCKKGISPVINIMQNVDAHIIDKRIPEYQRRKCVVIKDIEEIKDTSPREYAELARQNTKSLITAPLFDKGELIGYIGADNPPKEKIESIELFFTTISYFISSVMIKENNEKRLREIGYIDTLTNLYNRNKFIEDITLISGTSQLDFGVLYTDLNGLKEINDKHGHATGDKALITIANAIVKAFGRKNAYRVGGDEFVVLCPKCKETVFLENVTRLKNYISETEYTASIGYKHSSEPCLASTIIRIADEKMYQDKRLFYKHKKQSVRYRYKNNMPPMFPTQETLKKLISEERFFLLFQPRFDTKTKEMCGSEALIRYYDNANVILSPMNFLPEMEDNDIVHMIDFYVFRHVCKHISQWIKNGKNPKPVSINISHKTLLKPNFVENIMNIWYDYHIPKEFIEIEVSEDKEYGGVDDIVDTLAELKRHGFKIAVDNFGYRYADLYLFADLKFDILKLDKGLVHKIATDEKTRKLSASLAHICKNENIRLVAEGVENENGLRILQDIGCDEVQGYLFDKPITWKQLEQKYLK